MIQRGLAMVATAALLNALVAPAAAMCRAGDSPGAQAQAVEHGPPSGHDRMHGEQAEPAAMERSAGATIGEPTGCAGHDVACAEDCVAMPGCSATAFVVADGVESAADARNGVTGVSAAEPDGRTTAPDHPPPRA